MSDYVGALLRSAGLAGAAIPSPTLAPDTDLVEQDIEVEAQGAEPMAPRFGPLAAVLPDDAAPRRREREPSAYAAPARAVVEGDAEPSLRQALVPQHATPSSVSGSVPARGDGDSGAPVHPLVHAALRWVAADPGVRHELATPERAPTRLATPERAAPPPLAAARPAAPRTDEPARAPSRANAEPAPLPQAMAASPVTARPSADALQTFAAVPVARPAAAAAAAADTTPEVHIGAIHVTLDAPRAAPAPAQAAPPAAAAPRAAAPRSPYLRSRAPRV